MQSFMPDTQLRGTHAFEPSYDPSGSSSQLAQMLDIINAEEDGVEDQDGPLLNLPKSLANIPGASAFPLNNLVTPSIISSFH
jgi:hypothetical protein